MARLAVTITVQCMVPADDYDGRIGGIIDGLKSGLQHAQADYLDPVVTPGISAEASDAL